MAALLALASMALLVGAWWYERWRADEALRSRRGALVSGAYRWSVVDVPSAWPAVALASLGVALLVGAAALGVAVYVGSSDEQR